MVLLIGSEKASPWKETDKLLVAVTSSFVAAEVSVALPSLASRSGAKGLAAGTGRLRSTDTALLGSKAGELDTVPEFLETKGEGNLLEEEEEDDTEEEFEVEVEGEGDMYLEETTLDLGLLGLLIPLLPFSEGNNGGLLGLI